MAILGYCGFFHDLPTALVGDGASVVTTPNHFGAPALSIVYDGSNPAYFRLLDMTGAVEGAPVSMYATKLVASGYFRPASTKACEILSFIAYGTDEVVASLRRNGSGCLELYNGAGTLITTGTTVIPLYTWTFVQLTVNVAVDGAYSLSIDLAEDISGTANFGIVEIGEARFGVSTVTGSLACTNYWATVSANDTAELTTGQRVLWGYVGGDGTWITWDGDYTEVDDEESDGSATTISTSTAGARETVTIDPEALAAATVVKAVMCRTISAGESGACAHRNIFHSDGTDEQSALLNVSTSWVQGCKLDELDPATGLAWTLAGALAAEVGIRRSSGTGLSLCTCIWAEILIEEADHIIPYDSSKIAVAFMSDTHSTSGAPGLTHAKKCLEWIQQHGLTPVALAHSGDLNEDDEDENTFSTWIRAATGGNLPSWIPIVVAPGNWDAEDQPFTGNYGNVPADPFVDFKAAYSSQYAGANYCYWDFGSFLRIVAINDISDYLEDSGDSAYWNCNPPGLEHSVNPDFSGIVTESSALRTWLDAVFAPTAPRWRVLIAHRSFWAPYDTDPRKLNRDGRVALLTAITKGLSLVATGDWHGGSLSGPWYPAGGTIDPTAKYVAPGGVGAYSLTNAGGYLTRDVDETVLPNHATTCPWSSGGSGTKKAHATMLVLDATTNEATITVFESSDADPLGSVVYTGTLARNTAGGRMPSLTTQAHVIAVEDLFGELEDDGVTYVYTENEVLDWCDRFVEPMIKRELNGRYDLDTLADDTGIQELAARFLVALALGGQIGKFTGRDPERAKMLREDAWKDLMRIKKGQAKLITATRLTAGSPLQGTTSPDTRPSNQSFVGPPWEWQQLDEDRKS